MFGERGQKARRHVPASFAQREATLGLMVVAALAVSTCVANGAPVAPLRVSSTEKGSLLVFPNIELKWDAVGNLTQDTVLTLHNDFPAEVDVQLYYVNGDVPLEEVFIGFPVMRLEEAEPGWNTADCRLHLTSNQPTYWSAANGRPGFCQPFTILDPPALFGLPGRPDPETDGETRVLRGFVVAWAVGYREYLPMLPLTAGAQEKQVGGPIWQEINWNHLSGSALIVNYADAAVWEYSAYAFAAKSGEFGEPTDPGPGTLMLNGAEYEIVFDQLLLDFYASGSLALSRGRPTQVGSYPVSVDTDLTLLPMQIDLRQDGDGPPTVKAEFEIFNQNESKFSGTRKCVTCWHQALLSEFIADDSVPNHFAITTLGTDKGQARIKSVYSDECEGENEVVTVIPGPFLGVANKVVSFNAGDRTEYAGTTLPGMDSRPGLIRYDVFVSESGELRETGSVSRDTESRIPMKRSGSRGESK